MDPELLRQVLEAVDAWKAAGKTDADINGQLRRNRHIPFNSVTALRRHAASRGFNLREPKPATGIDRIQQNLAPAANALTFGLTADAIQALERLPGVPEGAGRRFRADLEAERAENPALSFATELGGAAMGLPRLAATGAIRALGPVVGAVGKGTTGLAKVLGAGERTRRAAAATTRGATGLAGATAIGAGGGAVQGFGESFGKSPDDRAADAGVSALVGGALALPLGVIGGAGSTGRNLLGRRSARPDRISDELNRLNTAPAPSEVQRTIGQAERRIADAATRSDDALVTRLTGERSALRDRLADAERRVGIADRLGLRGRVDELSKPFTEAAETLRKDIADITDKIDAARTAGDPARVARLTNAKASVQNGFNRGRQMAGSSTADELLEAHTTLLRAGDDAGAAAFRSGIVQKQLTSLSTPEAAATWVRKFRTSSDLRQKMQTAIADDDVYEELVRFVESEAVGMQAERVFVLLTSLGGFLAGRSSLAGKAAIEALEN